jgi:dienelactone hydrolase
VDPKDIGDSGPAAYPIDPAFSKSTTTSTEWEQYGLDPAYEGPNPSKDKPFPLVMFSSGWGCAPWHYIFVGTRLASHGFVVAITQHYGDMTFVWDGAYDIAECCFHRPIDVSFTIDRLLEMNENSTSVLRGLMKPDQIAASGHSLGGYCALVLAGGDDNVGDHFYNDTLFPGDPPPYTCAPGLPDPRIKAVVTLSAASDILFWYELGRIKVPTMGIGEEWSALAANKDFFPVWPADYHARQHAAINAKPCYRVDIANSLHSPSFMNWCESIAVCLKNELIYEFYDGWVDENWLNYWYYAQCGYPNLIPNQESWRITTQYMIAFLKTYLNGEQGYKNMLTPGWAITREKYVEFFVTEKRNGRSPETEFPDYFWYFIHQPGSEQAKALKNRGKALSVPHPLLGK